MTDVVYILGTGSRWNDNEIKFSLRSVAKHLKNFRRIVVIGSIPRFGTDLVPFSFVPKEDCYGDKQQNAREKLHRIAKLDDVSDSFVLMNDDFFFLRDVDAATLPYYRQGTLADHIEWREERPSNYLRALKRTQAALLLAGLPTRDFEIHAPMRYTRAGLREVFEVFPEEGLLTRSLFANLLKIDGKLLSDCKLDSPLPRAEIERRVAERDFFSIGDGGLNEDMKKFLSERFPK